MILKNRIFNNAVGDILTDNSFGYFLLISWHKTSRWNRKQTKYEITNSALISMENQFDFGLPHKSTNISWWNLRPSNNVSIDPQRWIYSESSLVCSDGISGLRFSCQKRKHCLILHNKLSVHAPQKFHPTDL